MVDGAGYYGYVIEGPETAGPFEVHAFHPEKLLLDPYARAVYFPAAFDREAARDGIANIGRAALGVIDARAPAFDWHADRPPHHEADAIVYELHVRGFTQHASSGVPSPRAAPSPA